MLSVRRLLSLLIGASLLIMISSSLNLTPVRAASTGLDVVFLLENRDDDYGRAGVRNQDFATLDPSNERYAAIRLAGQLLIEDSYGIQPGSTHTLSVIRFDASIDQGSDNQGIWVDPVTIQAATSENAAQLNSTLNNLIQPPRSEETCYAESRRCGADFEEAFKTAKGLLRDLKAEGRRQIIIILTVDGCAGTEICAAGGTENAHKAQMGAVANDIDDLEQADVGIYFYALYGTEQQKFDNETFQLTRNRTWSLFSDDEWKNLEGKLAALDILPQPREFVPRVRDILLSNLDWGFATRLQTNAGSHKFAIDAYNTQLELVYFKANATDDAELYYDNPNAPNYTPALQEHENEFFKTLTILNPAPGNFWSLVTQQDSGLVYYLVRPAQPQLKLTHAGKDIGSEFPLYQDIRVEYSALGAGGETLFYDDRGFDLQPVAEITNVDDNRTFRVPLTLNRSSGAQNGVYQGNFYTVTAGTHRVHILLEGSNVLPQLEAVEEMRFDATPVTYTVQFDPARQFETWNYHILFYDQQGSPIALDTFAVTPRPQLHAIHDEQTLSVSAPDAVGDQFVGDYIFEYHGSHTLKTQVQVPDVNGDLVPMQPSQQPDYEVRVAPTKLRLELLNAITNQPDSDVLQYEMVHARLMPDSISIDELARYNLSFDLVLTQGETEQRASLEHTNEDYSATFYPTGSGSYTVQVEGYRLVGGRRLVFVTSDQIQRNLQVAPVTVGFLNENRPEQFQPWNFTVALLSNGLPVQQELAPSLAPEIKLRLAGVLLPFTSLQPGLARNQWTGTYTFKVFGEQTASFEATVSSSSDVNQQARTVLMADRDYTLDVAPSVATLVIDQAEQLMLEPVQFTLNAPGVTNRRLREEYQVSVQFEVSVDVEGGETRTERISAQPATEDPDAPFIASFKPVAPGKHRVVPILTTGVEGLGQITLDVGVLMFDVRPLTLALRVDDSPAWKLDEASGNIQVEVNRPISFTASFYDGEPDGQNNVQRQTPSLGVTVQGKVFKDDTPVADAIFAYQEETNTYQLQGEQIRSVFDTVGTYRLLLVGQQADGAARSFQLPLASNIRDGLILKVIPVGEIILRLSSETALRQNGIGIIPFSGSPIILDIETLLQQGTDTTPIAPRSLFSEDAAAENDWFIVRLDGAEVPNTASSTGPVADISYPQELPNGFRLQLSGLSLGQHKIEVQPRSTLQTAFGIRSTSNSTLSQADFDVVVNPLQIAIFWFSIPLVLLILLGSVLRRRFAFNRDNQLRSGVLFLEDDYGNVLWKQRLDSTRKATAVQKYTKSDGGVTGWGRAILDEIQISSDPQLRSRQEIRLMIKQNGKTLPPITMKLDGSTARQQLPDARRGFYVRVSAADTPTVPNQSTAKG
jgi:hypothetical protein